MAIDPGKRDLISGVDELQSDGKIASEAEKSSRGCISSASMSSDS